MNFEASDVVVIDHLRIAWAGGDPHEAARRVAAVLDGVNWRPTSLPPAAILCVRRLEDPLPGRMPMDGGRGEGMRAWEAAMNAALDRLARAAARPAHGPPPAAAPAVVFADRAEWLACLADDWCSGALPERWWWQPALRGQDVSRAAPAAWLAAPAHAPAALGRLAARRRAVAFVRRLDDGTARALVQAIARRFALPALQEVAGPGAPEPVSRGLATRATTRPDAAPRGSPARATTPGESGPRTSPALRPSPPPTGAPAATPPWAEIAPESLAAGLSAAQAALLGVGLTLSRRPAEARRSTFAEAARQWWAATSGAVTNGAAAGAARPSQPLPRPAALSFRPAPPSGATPTATDPAGRESVARAITPPGVSPPAADSQTAQHDEPLAASIDTEWGGLFYLVNAALALGLYGDFTTPLQPGLPLPIWDFLALLGQELFGEALRADPVWPLLAALSGRPDPDVFDDGPTAVFDPPADWRLPPAWLDAFPERGVWRYAVERGRLRVWHPAGFAVLDIPFPYPARVQGDYLLEALAPYAAREAVAVEPGSLPPAPSGPSPLRRWVGRLAPYVRARLARALGDADDLAGRLGRHRARLYLTDTQLDIVLGLDELPIAIRLAGLDRDPGWLPSAGRAIGYHFT